MNKKEISKAALQYAQNKYCKEDNGTPQYKIAQIHAGRDGFKAGAEWRINSVWHGIDDVPELKRVILVITDGMIITSEIHFVSTWESLRKNGKNVIWAYVDDLRPSIGTENEKSRYIREPFDVDTAKKIMNGEIPGRIVTMDGQNVRIVCWDYRSTIGDSPIIALVESSIYEQELTYTKEGKYFAFGNRCMIDDKYDLVIELIND